MRGNYDIKKNHRLVVWISGGPGRTVIPMFVFTPWAPFTCVPNRSVLVRPIKKPPFGGLDFWWPWSDSNRHSSQNLILSQARLPIPPQGHGCTAETVLGSLFCINFFYQAGTAVWFVCRLFGRGFCFADFLFNGFFNSSHFFG